MDNINDLISRTALLKDLSYCAPELWQDEEYIKAKIMKQHAVDTAPVVHARWHELKDGTEECTNCLGLCPHEENYNGDVIFNFGCEYCPWCGAKMDGERRDEDAAD